MIRLVDEFCALLFVLVSTRLLLILIDAAPRLVLP